MARLRERGCSVPRVMSVVGCDDIPAATMHSPTLTSVALRRREMGRLAIEALMSLGEASAEAVLVPSHLVARLSTGLARGTT